MKNHKLEKFLKAKNQILDNLGAIQYALVESVNDGFGDPEDEYYNQVSALIGQAEEAVELAELEIVVFKAHDFEMILDNWSAKEGKTSFGLTWPNLEESIS